MQQTETFTFKSVRNFVLLQIFAEFVDAITNGIQYGNLSVYACDWCDALHMRSRCHRRSRAHAQILYQI